MIIVQVALSSRTIIVRELHDNRTHLITFPVFSPFLRYEYRTLIVQLSYDNTHFSLRFSERQPYASCTRIVRLSYYYRTIVIRLSYDYHTIIVRFAYDYPTIIVRLSYDYDLACATIWTHSPHSFHCTILPHLSRCPHNTLENTAGASTFQHIILMRRLVRGSVPSCLLCVVQGNYLKTAQAEDWTPESSFTQLVGHRVSEHVGL